VGLSCLTHFACGKNVILNTVSSISLDPIQRLNLTVGT